MEAFEFKAKIRDGVIHVPQKYSQKLGNTVKVIILSEQRTRRTDMIDELLAKPVKISSFKPFSRDDMYLCTKDILSLSYLPTS